MISEIIIILILGLLIAGINRSHLAATNGGEQDEVWSAFEAAMQSTDVPADTHSRLRSKRPDGHTREDETEETETDEELANLVGQVRTSIARGDTTVKLMDVGTVGFINATDALVDDYGHLWLRKSAPVYSFIEEGYLAVSRQPEGWFLQRYAQPGGHLSNGKEAIRVIGHFDFR